MSDDARTCPDCHAGKHDNCTGEAWDNVKDEPCVCDCWEMGHRNGITPVKPEPMHSVVLVPVGGVVSLMHSALPVDMKALLELDGRQGRYVGFTLRLDDFEGEVGYLLSDEPGPENTRAREILARLSGMHVLMHGTVAFRDLPPNEVVGLIRST